MQVSQSRGHEVSSTLKPSIRFRRCRHCRPDTVICPNHLCHSNQVGDACEMLVTSDGIDALRGNRALHRLLVIASCYGHLC